MTWLVNNWRSVLWSLLAGCAVLFGFTARHYHIQYISAASLAESRQETINDLQRRQKSVALLDQKYTRELADAQATIFQLQRDVTAGKRRLQLNASCPGRSSASASRLDDAARPRLTDAAEQNYFILRNRIEFVEKQITGLQQYIREQCLR